MNDFMEKYWFKKYVYYEILFIDFKLYFLILKIKNNEKNKAKKRETSDE